MPSSFTDLGFSPNHTYDRIQEEIRDSENGSPAPSFKTRSLQTANKPGPCQYTFGSGADPLTFPGHTDSHRSGFHGFSHRLGTRSPFKYLERCAHRPTSQTDSRHEVWALVDIWNTSPFAGPHRHRILIRESDTRSDQHLHRPRL